MAPRPPAAPGRSSRLAAVRLAALLLVLVVGGAWLLHGELLRAPAPLMDEEFYLGASARVRAGGDPYDQKGYLYAPPYAHLLAALEERAAAAVLPVLRGSGLVGLWVLVWVSLAGSPWPWPARAAAALAIVAAPVTANGIGCGNASVALVGPALAAVALAPRRPWVGGLLGGAVNAFKPLGVGALFVAVAPERGGRLPRWAPRFTAATLLSAAAWLTVGREHLVSMLRNSGGLPEFRFNLALHRALASLDVGVHPVVPFALATLGGMALVRWRVRDGRARVAVAGTTCLLGLPLVNVSTFLFSVPAQVLAVERALAVASASWRAGSRGRAVAELALVAAAIASVQGSYGGISAQVLPFPFEGLVVMIPLAAAAALTLYGIGVLEGPARQATSEAGAVVLGAASP